MPALCGLLLLLVFVSLFSCFKPSSRLQISLFSCAVFFHIFLGKSRFCCTSKTKQTIVIPPSTLLVPPEKRKRNTNNQQNTENKWKKTQAKRGRQSRINSPGPIIHKSSSGDIPIQAEQPVVLSIIFQKTYYIPGVFFNAPEHNRGISGLMNEYSAFLSPHMVYGRS